MDHTKKATLGIVFILIVAAAALFFLSPSPTANGGLPAAATQARFGVLLPLTGKIASYGERVNKGIALAAEEINAQGDLKITLIREDTQSDPAQAVRAAQKLLEVDGVRIIIGPAGSTQTLAVAPLTEKEKVLLFAPGPSAEDITHAGEFVFRNRETAALHGAQMARFLRLNGIGDAAVLTAQAANSRTYGTAFAKEFRSLGGNVVFETEYAANQKDFRTEIAKVRAQDPDAVYVAAVGGKDAGDLVRQLAQQGFGGLITGSPAFESTEFLDGAQSASEGALYTAAVLDATNPKTAAFIEKYEARFGSTPDGFAANGYDAAYILVEAVKQCGSDQDTACIRDYLYALKEYPGVGGRTRFDAFGDVEKPLQVKTIRDGQFVPHEAE